MTNNNNSSNNNDQATFNCSPCTYHRDHTLNIPNLSLSHEGGRGSLFNSADVVLKHGTIAGLVGTNGAGKTSLARVLAGQELTGFPSGLNIEYLAASDDEEYLAGWQNDDYESMLALTPLEYIELRIQHRSDKLRQEIEELEQKLETNEGYDSDGLEKITNQLSDLYDVEEALNEKMQRELDHAMQDLGLTKYQNKQLSMLSSGWRYKCRLVAAFLTHPDLLIIDEPSFLDDKSTQWFVTQTQKSAKTENAIILFISHKEALLNTLCDEILYINSANQTLTTYHCGYSIFRETHMAQVEHAAKTVAGTEKKFHSAEKSLKHVQTQLRKREQTFKAKTTENADKRFIKGKNKEAKQKADKSAAAKLKQTKKEVQDLEEIKRQAQKERVKPLRLDGIAGDGTIVTFQDVGVGYDDNNDDSLIFENVDVCIEASDRILLTGPNGCGKSTLVQVLLGALEPTVGSATHKGDIVTFPQTILSQLIRTHGQTTARDFIMNGSSMTETQARQQLGNFGLARDCALQPIATLSAGQRVRLWLAREQLLHSKPCLMVLDEISENVDVETRNSLLDLLANFEGAVLVVSHDADFRNSFQYTKLWELGRYGVRERHPE